MKISVVIELETLLQDKENSISELRVQYQTMKEQNVKLEDELQRIKTELASKGNNQESQEPKEQQNLETQKDNRKPKITIAGDSIVKNLHGWMMSRNKSVKVSCFPRATTQDIVSYLKPLINRKPEVKMCDKMAIYAYILKIVEKDPLLRLQMSAKEMLNRHQLFSHT